LADMKSQRAIDALIGLLKDQSPGVRASAAAALGRLGDPRAGSAIETAFKEAPEDNLDYAIALYRLGIHDHVDIVGQALKSHYQDQRVESLAVLSESADSRALDSLVAVVSPATTRPTLATAPAPLKPELRIQLALALAKYSDQRAGDALISMLADPEPEVRAAAVGALADFTSRVAPGQPKGGAPNALLDPGVNAVVSLIKTERSPIVLAAVARSIDRLGRERVVDALLPLADSSPNIREALNELGVTAQVMSDKLRDGKGPERIRAVRILGQLRYHDAVPSLIDACNASKEVDFKLAAAETLGLIGDRRAEDALIHATQMPEPPVRAAAIKALGKLGDATVTETLF